jgi:hypothetical protein
MVNTPGPTLAVEDGRSKNLMRPCGHLSNQAARAIVAALLAAVTILLPARLSGQVTIDSDGISSASDTIKTKHKIDPVSLLDGKLMIDIPTDFAREPVPGRGVKTVAKFARKDGAWGEVLRGTHGLTPDKLNDYLKMRVTEYSKGFDWLPKDSHLQWLKKEIVTIDGRKWADWRFVPMLNNQTSYGHSPVYTRFLTTSYKGQLLEINFTTNLTTEPELKEKIDRIMDSVRLEE